MEVAVSWAERSDSAKTGIAITLKGSFILAAIEVLVDVSDAP